MAEQISRAWRARTGKDRAETAGGRTCGRKRPKACTRKKVVRVSAHQRKALWKQPADLIRLAAQEEKRCLLFTLLFRLPALPGVGLGSRTTQAREDLIQLLQRLRLHRNVERPQVLVKLLSRAWPDNRCSHYRVCQ